MRSRHLILVAFFSALALTACTTGGIGGAPKATFTPEPGVVDAEQAAALISQYRQSKGRSVVKVDPTLMAIAQTHSDRMAASGTMSHVLPGEGSFMNRLKSGNYDPGMAAENVAMGQPSFAEVFQDWKNSPSHNANMLEEHIDDIGIAVSTTAGSKYKYFWTLVLGKRRPTGGMVSGPVMQGVGGATVEIH